MRAVMWTDVIQLACMLVGTSAIIVGGLVENGGPGNILRKLEATGRLDLAV